MQALQNDARSRRFVLLLAEHPGCAVEKLGFPLGDLIGVDVKLLRKLGERLLPFTAAKATFASKDAVWFRRGLAG